MMKSGIIWHWFVSKIYGPVHANLIHIACAQTPSRNAHGDVGREARSIFCGMSHHLHPYFVYASSKDPGESVHMGRLARDIVSGQCDTYKHLTCWLNYASD